MWCFRSGFRCLLSTKEGKNKGCRGDEEEGDLRIDYSLGYFFGVGGLVKGLDKDTEVMFSI